MSSSYYDDRDRRSDDRRNDKDDRRGDRDRKRHSRRQSPVYEQEEIIEARRRAKGSRDDTRDDRSDRRSTRDDKGGGQLVRRGRDDDSDYDEEIPRGHIPDGRRRSGRDDPGPPRRAKSARDYKRGSSRYDDDYDSYDDEPPRRRGGDRGDRRREITPLASRHDLLTVQKDIEIFHLMNQNHHLASAASPLVNKLLQHLDLAEPPVPLLLTAEVSRMAERETDRAGADGAAMTPATTLAHALEGTRRRTPVPSKRRYSRL